MTRRALFAALASLPFVGRSARQPVRGFTMNGERCPTRESAFAAYREANRYRINCGPNDRPAFEEFGGPV